MTERRRLTNVICLKQKRNIGRKNVRFSTENRPYHELISVYVGGRYYELKMTLEEVETTEEITHVPEKRRTGTVL